MEIRDKIIEKSGASEVFAIDGEGNSEYNQIKSRIEINSRGY